MRGCAFRLLIAGAAIGLFPAGARAGEVVVFPLSANDIEPAMAEAATRALRSAMGSIREIRALDTEVVEAELGVRLIEQARACEYDVFCLVEVGEVLRSERMLVGHVAKSARTPGALELKLFVLDVRKSAVTDTLVWSFPSTPGALEAAVRTAARRLFQTADARIRLELTPRDAEVRIFGEVLSRSPEGSALFWSGTYEATVAAEGYQTQSFRLDIPQGGPKTFALELQPDLLHVKKPRDPRAAAPFDRASRRTGSGVSAEQVATDAPEAARASAFANPLAWSVAGAGVVAAAVGVGLAVGAQGRYNSRAGDLRYADTMEDATDARGDREDARRGYRAGAVLAGCGAALTAGGLVWMLIQSALDGKPSPRGRASGRASSFALEVAW